MGAEKKKKLAEAEAEMNENSPGEFAQSSIALVGIRRGQLSFDPCLSRQPEPIPRAPKPSAETKGRLHAHEITHANRGT